MDSLVLTIQGTKTTLKDPRRLHQSETGTVSGEITEGIEMGSALVGSLFMDQRNQ